MPKREIYLLSPRTLSPETIAVAFAKTSRSPESFRVIAAQLSDEKSAQFHEKWVVGYGHASVAEHAVLHIAFENVSRLAIESIEGNRLASYTEKSTRYQRWGQDDFTVLPAASLANVGMTANARVLENTIRKMLSHELEEVRQIGERVKEVALSETPTLVKYAEAVTYL